MLKNLFPTCAGFGPLFMFMGFFYSPALAPCGVLLAALGAMMTSTALFVIHRRLTSLEQEKSVLEKPIKA